MSAFSYDAITIDVLADGRPALLSVYRNHVRMALPLERAVAYGVAGELGLAVRGAAIMGLPGPVTVNVEESVGASGAAIASWIAQALPAALHRAAVDAGVSYEIAELRVDEALRDPRSTAASASTAGRSPRRRRANRAINHPMAVDDQDRVDAIVAALSAGRLADRWPDHLQPRDAVDELTRWLRDDHQWGAPRSAPHWRSLIRDVVDALGDLGPAAQAEIAVERATVELRQCEAEFESKSEVKEPALRQRLLECAHSITERAASPDAVMVAWDDVVVSAHDREVGAARARAFLSLASWIGHDGDWIVRRITRALDGEHAARVGGRLVSPETGISLNERLSTARATLAVEPARAHMTVWLRFQLARIRSPPVIRVGAEVCIYQGDWLRSCLCAPLPFQELPPEATGDDAWSLRDFCGVQPAHVDTGGPPHDPDAVPVAYVRVDVGYELAALAVGIARSTAEALAALGAVYGEAPTIWRLDRSYRVFSGDRDIGSSDEAEEPGWTETVGVAEDRTAELIHQLSDRLAGHFPFRDRELQEAMAMVGWLRGARSAPPEARLVLCDRVIEAACGWAGMSKRAAFVKQDVIPWWAYSRLESLARAVAHGLTYGHRPAGLQADDPSWAAWEEILNHEPLGLRKHPPDVRDRTLVAEVPWLLERVPPDTRLARDLRELDGRTRTCPEALAYWNAWQARGERIEARRGRTRNAIIHGGPLSPATVDSVALFAEDIASRALITSLDAKLAGKTVASHFKDRRARIADMTRRLQRNDPNDPPAGILFFNPNSRDPLR